MIQILRMPPIPYDLAIIGGGPAGLACALGAGKRRLSVLLLEKHLPGRKPLISGTGQCNLTYYQRLVARAWAALPRHFATLHSGFYWGKEIKTGMAHSEMTDKSRTCRRTAILPPRDRLLLIFCEKFVIIA